MKIARMCVWLHRACWLFAFALSFGFAFGWYQLLNQESLFALELPINLLMDYVTFWQWAIAITLSSLPMLAVVIALSFLSKLMLEFSSGRYFSEMAIHRLHRFSAWLLSSTFLKIVLVPALSLVLTLNNPPGMRQLVVSLESHDFSLVLIAAVFYVITRILQEGRRITIENAEFV